MAGIPRYSPVTFNSRVHTSEIRDNWKIVLGYQEEGPGPWLVDLSHKPRWDLQDSQIDNPSSSGLAVPRRPGDCLLKKDRLINRLNRTQATIWHLGIEEIRFPDFKGFTDVTESTVFLAFLGPNVFHVAEKLTALDLMSPARTAPFLLQGPLCHVPCQVVVLERHADMSGAYLLACSRGYADSMVQAILVGGQEFGLRPAGETRFANWVQNVSIKEGH
ncbi:MAG: sarcosine oxidase subunit gamma SoxG [Deltaproteobacteria bacterium]|jgi:hypothetical protein|nr:sarcosine oxidase subunit gamma SoxG [Deltaproteobacteria bacterium]